MSEWSLVLAVFWVLWALDGARLAPRRIFTFVGGRTYRVRRGTVLQPAIERRDKVDARAEASRSSGMGALARWRARISYSRLSLPGMWPGSWRMTGEDVPLSLSPAGVCNRPAGSAGRPAEGPAQAEAWRWDEVRDVGVARGWLFVNGVRFCADTGHVKAPELLELACLPAAVRGKRIDALMRRWLRPAHLRRRAKVLTGRTAVPAMLNTIAFVGLGALTTYVLGDVASKLPSRWSELLVEILPWLLVGFVTLHAAAVAMTSRAARRLKLVNAKKRASTLFSVLLLPPQALRLRAWAGEGFFPAQHPLAGTLAFADGTRLKRWAFNAVADLHWPLDNANDPLLAGEITEWFRKALEARMVPLLTAAGVTVHTLQSAPMSDAPASCSYCPRCHDQFVAARSVCPNGVPLRRLAGSQRTVSK